jgi:hypothetical protein
VLVVIDHEPDVASEVVEPILTAPSNKLMVTLGSAVPLITGVTVLNSVLVEVAMIGTLGAPAASTITETGADVVVMPPLATFALRVVMPLGSVLVVIDQLPVPDEPVPRLFPFWSSSVTVRPVGEVPVIVGVWIVNAPVGAVITGTPGAPETKIVMLAAAELEETPMKLEAVAVRVCGPLPRVVVVIDHAPVLGFELVVPRMLPFSSRSMIATLLSAVPDIVGV